ncbi:MAG TPA: ABC transporter ATP-binding protein, partial [Dermatophilaceae bacterium]|nr:ABC transporter ATP-binding protein [Dermatophilaceae bacterium]
VRRDDEHLLVVTNDAAAVTRALAGHGLYVHELATVRPDLEAAFLSLTADEGLGTEADRRAGGLTTGAPA